MNVNLFYSKKPKSFDECCFAEHAIKNELALYADNQLNGCILLYGQYGTGKSTAAEMIARDRGADFDDIHFVRLNGSQFGDVRKSSLLQNAMQWGIINYKTPVLIVDEVDVLSKESQIWLRSFIDTWQHRSLIMLTTNYIGNVDGSIRDRCDCLEIKGFTPTQASDVIMEVLKNNGLKLDKCLIEQQAALELTSSDSLLSLRTVGRLCDKLALDAVSNNAPKPSIKLVTI